jgi:hypothetical protein
MKIKTILTVIWITLLATNSIAQEEIEPVKFKHGIGVGAGFATGYGLSYKYTPNKFGIQVNFAPFKNQTTSRYSTGLTFSYDLVQGNSSKLYLYQANHFYYNSYKNELIDKDNVPYTTTTTEQYFNNGLGFGFEFTVLKRLGINLMTGYAFYDNFNTINITGEMALYYKF